MTGDDDELNAALDVVASVTACGKAVEHAVRTMEDTAANFEEAERAAFRSVRAAVDVAEHAAVYDTLHVQAVAWANAAALAAKIVSMMPTHPSTELHRSRLAEFECLRDVAWAEVRKTSDPGLWDRYDDAAKALQLAKTERANDLKRSNRTIRVMK